MGLKGDLATMGLEDIFQCLAVGNKTGVLELKGFLHTKRVYFGEGRVTGVWSSDPREYLGQYLLAYNRITEEQLLEALATQEDENQLLGRILVNKQLISESEIRKIVHMRVEETVYDTFLWDMGTFEFHDGPAGPAKNVALSLDVTGIVLEGARRKDDTLPPRLLNEPVAEGPSKGWVSHLEPMLVEYYRTRGWDENGVPKKRKLEELGLADLV